MSEFGFKPGEVANQVAPVEKPKPRVSEMSIPEGETIFSREQVVSMIASIATAEGVAAKDLVVEEETIVVDKQGNVVRLIMNVTPEEAKARGWGQLLYEYTIRGRYGRGFPSSSVTCVSRVAVSMTDPDDFTFGGNVGEMVDGKWVERPGEVANTVAQVSVEKK